MKSADYGIRSRDEWRKRRRKGNNILHSEYIAKSLAKENCNECNDLLSPEKVEMDISFETRCSDMDDTTTQAKEEFVTAISRLHLCCVSAYEILSRVHVFKWSMVIIIHFPRVIFCDIQTSKSGYFAIFGLAYCLSQITVLFNA